MGNWNFSPQWWPGTCSPNLGREKTQLDAFLPASENRVLTRVSFSVAVDFTATFLNNL